MDSQAAHLYRLVTGVLFDHTKAVSTPRDAFDQAAFESARFQFHIFHLSLFRYLERCKFLQD